MVCKEVQDHRVTQACKGLLEELGNRDRLELQELQDHQDPKDSQVEAVSLASPVFRETLAFQD